MMRYFDTLLAKNLCAVNKMLPIAGVYAITVPVPSEFADKENPEDRKTLPRFANALRPSVAALSSLFQSENGADHGPVAAPGALGQSQAIAPYPEHCCTIFEIQWRLK